MMVLFGNEHCKASWVKEQDNGFEICSVDDKALLNELLSVVESRKCRVKGKE